MPAPDENERKRRELIMAMSRDMGRGKESADSKVPYRTPEAKMSQGSAEDKPIEDTFQLDDMVPTGILKAMAKGVAKPMMSVLAGKAGNKLAGPMHMSGDPTRKIKPDPYKDKWARVMRGDVADVKSANVPPSQHETMWMSDDFAKQMGRAKDPTWQRFMDDPTVVTGKQDNWLEKATMRPQEPNIPPSAHETIWMREQFAKDMGVPASGSWEDFARME